MTTKMYLVRAVIAVAIVGAFLAASTVLFAQSTTNTEVEEFRTQSQELHAERQAKMQALQQRIQQAATNQEIEGTRGELEEIIADIRALHQDMRAKYQALIAEYRTRMQAFGQNQSAQNRAMMEAKRAEVQELRAAKFSEVCHRLSQTTALPQGFGAPFDVTVPARPLIFTADCDPVLPEASVAVGSGSNNQFVYEKGFVLKNNRWEEFTLAPLGEKKEGQWVVGKGIADITLGDAQIERPNFVLTYMCTWTGEEWKCGCRDEACTQPHWQLQTIERAPASQ